MTTGSPRQVCGRGSKRIVADAARVLGPLGPRAWEREKSVDNHLTPRSLGAPESQTHLAPPAYRRSIVEHETAGNTRTRPPVRSSLSNRARAPR